MITDEEIIKVINDSHEREYPKLVIMDSVFAEEVRAVAEHFYQKGKGEFQFGENEEIAVVEKDCSIYEPIRIGEGLSKWRKVLRVIEGKG